MKKGVKGEIGLKKIYVYKISNINPLIENHKNTYSIIDLCSIL